MKKTVKLIVILLMLFCAACIWPFCLVRRDETLNSGDSEAYSYTDPLVVGDEVEQEFVPQQSYLKEMSFALRLEEDLPSQACVEYALFRIGDGTDGQTLALDDKEALLRREFYGDELNASGYCTVPVEQWLKQGETYAWRVRILSVEGLAESEVNDAQVQVVCTPGEANFAPGSLRLMKDGTQLAGQAYGSYAYTKPLNLKNVLTSMLCIMTIGAALLGMLGGISLPGRWGKTKSE